MLQSIISETLFSALSKAEAKAFSNMGYNNVDGDAASKYGVGAGNTHHLSLAAARRIVEADGFMRAGLYDRWLPHLYDPVDAILDKGSFTLEELDETIQGVQSCQ
ncbi:hypothetical protein L1987_74125 [Smallanthus sonchifolius]|uniref:Uncharacterized protein n=2 Tax=Smallanthus sonchifolius TaxID=185202 RepID=A0ACB9A1R5_9ASTR|nr:hypothetical protein L1987_74122 [Smallanthus sonchifolius]KAI3703929.1 hypothetical protein L1987_74125 [Smallanthus sonchifolius]